MSQIIELLEMAERCIRPPSSFCTKAHEFLSQAIELLKQQPPAGEFMVQRYSVSSTGVVYLERDGDLCLWKAVKDRLDRAEAILKDIIPALRKIKKEQKIDPFYLDTLIAVAENAIVEQAGYPVEGKPDNPDPPPNSKQPPAGELLPWQHRLAEEYDRKQFLEMIERYNQKLSGVWDDDFTIIGSELLTIISLGWGAVFRLDRAEAINKDLAVACKRMLGAMRCDELNNGRVFNDDLRKEVKNEAEAAIAQYKKVGG